MLSDGVLCQFWAILAVNIEKYLSKTYHTVDSLGMSNISGLTTPRLEP